LRRPRRDRATAGTCLRPGTGGRLAPGADGGEPDAGRGKLPAPARGLGIPAVQDRCAARRRRPDRGDHHVRRRPVPGLRAPAHDELMLRQAPLARLAAPPGPCYRLPAAGPGPARLGTLLSWSIWLRNWRRYPGLWPSPSAGRGLRIPLLRVLTGTSVSFTGRGLTPPTSSPPGGPAGASPPGRGAGFGNAGAGRELTAAEAGASVESHRRGLP